MTIHIDAWSDFTCPFCFLNSLRLRRMASIYDISVRWRSFQLRPPGVPDMPLHLKATAMENRERAALTLKEEENIIIRPGPVDSDTRLAQTALQYATQQNRGTAFHAAVMEAYWRREAVLEDEDTLVPLAASAGFDLESLGLAWEDSLFATLVDSDRALASQYGVGSAPAILVAKKYLVSGAQPMVLLEDVIQRAEKEYHASTPVPLAS